MKAYEFRCGGDHGAWECLVDVKLTDEEETILKEFAKDEKNEFIDWFPPMDKIWTKVMSELEKQCTDDFDADSVVIWIPTGLRADGL